MSIKNRVEKLEAEAAKCQNEILVIEWSGRYDKDEWLNENFPPGTPRPKTIIFATELDMRL